MNLLKSYKLNIQTKIGDMPSKWNHAIVKILYGLHDKSLPARTIGLV